MHERADAHQARLDRHVHHRAAEAVVPDATRRVAKRHDLRVRGGIDGANRLVESAADDLAVEDDDRAHGHLAGGVGPAGLVQREPHESLVILHDAIIQAG